MEQVQTIGAEPDDIDTHYLQPQRKTQTISRTAARTHQYKHCLKQRKGIGADIVYFLTQACSVLCFHIRSRTWLDHEVPEEVMDIFEYNLHHGIDRLHRSYSSGQQLKLKGKGGKFNKGSFKGNWSKGKGKKGGGKSWVGAPRRQTEAASRWARGGWQW